MGADVLDGKGGVVVREVLLDELLQAEARVVGA
jgi:hypothetical protein